MPGSRAGEIERLGGDFAGAAERFLRRYSDSQVLVPLANQQGRAQFLEIADAVGLRATFSDRVRVSVGDARACIAAADVLLMASGTATLEGLLHGKPMVVAYRVAPSTYRLVRAFDLVKLEHFSLPNLLTPEPLVKEILQDDVTPDALQREIEALLDAPERADAMRQAFQAVHRSLAVDADVRAATAVLETARL